MAPSSRGLRGRKCGARVAAVVAATLATEVLNVVTDGGAIALQWGTQRRFASMCHHERVGGGAMLASWVQAVHRMSVGGHRVRELNQRSVATADASLLRRALRRPSDVDMELDDEPPRQYTLRVDERALLRFAGSGRRLVASWTTGGPKRYSIARNLAFSIRRNCPELEPSFVFVALDRDAFERATADGFQVVLNEGSVDLKDDIWKMRWLIQTTFLALGLEVLVVDSDIVFFRDPFAHMHFDSDQEVSTDHLFPREQLWTTWLRPAEHINTGFIFARPSPTLIAFLVEFIDRHYHEFFDRHLERDGMDQRAYNRFVMEKMEAERPGAISVYEDLVFDRLDWQEGARASRYLPRKQWLSRASNRWPMPPGSRPVRIRVLDPAEIAHGMNFFWRKAHRLRAGGPDLPGGGYRPPAIAHVNGVDPKQYFLRDRNVWYVEEWAERFGERPSFLTYDHPQHLSLKEDFEHLMAAIEVAAYLRRRVVLPDTMNCANSPAYEVWRMNETLREEPGCTYDYFAHANGLYEVYSRMKPFSVEAGLRRTEHFRRLAASSTVLPSLGELRGSAVFREEILGLRPGVAAFDSARVLHVGGDVRELREALRQGDFGFRMSAEGVFSCAYQETLASAMACLDEPYVEEFGPGALERCEAAPGCGPVGVCCCWPFWGYGEKLQYFTNVSWDLPCNCGLELCEGYDRPAEGASEFCCRHAGDPSLYPKLEEGVFPCRERGRWSGRTATEDAHTYSTAALSEFLRGKRTAAQTFQTCRLDREMRRGEAFREVSLRWCNLQMSAFLLREEAPMHRAKIWWEWMLEQRRGAGGARLLVAALDGNGTETDNTEILPLKLRHDLEQLRHIVEEEPPWDGPAPWRAAIDMDFVSESLLPKFRRAVESLDEGIGQRSRDRMLDTYEAIGPFYNRALYVPDVRLPPGKHATTMRERRREAEAADVELRAGGVAILDGVLTQEAVSLSREVLQRSTIWYAAKRGGAVLKAQLRDGLHAELVLRLAQELRQELPSLRAQPLLDVVAYKFDSTPEAALPPRCEDGVVVVNIWVMEGASEADHGGIEIFNYSVPQEFSYQEAHGFNDQAVVQQAVVHVERRVVPYRVNRATMWRAKQAFRTAWDPLQWSRRYSDRRVDLMFLFGRSQVRGDRRAKGGGGSYSPSFEGREDASEGHYYAKDHDHR